VTTWLDPFELFIRAYECPIMPEPGRWESRWTLHDLCTNVQVDRCFSDDLVHTTCQHAWLQAPAGWMLRIDDPSSGVVVWG
jgi:hypothetical protein